MSRKILLVDDDPILRLALEKSLAAHREAFGVVTAADGFFAVKELEKFPFSLIVVDLLMPRMDGMSLIAHIRGNYPELPIVVISALEPAGIEERVKASGVVAFLSKPFRADDLVALIMGCLRQEADGGIMYDVSPTIFLQLMEMEAKTCTVRVFDKASAQGGIVYFIEGRLVDARVGGRKGIDAAYEVFTWETVTLFIHNGCKPRENTINSDLQPIIMKAVGMKDESDVPHDIGEGDNQEPQSLVAQVKNLLLRTVGKDCLAGFSYEEKMGKAVEHLQDLGAAADFGRLHAGVIRGDKQDKILLPGQPAPVFSVSAGCLRPQVLARIRNAGF